MVQEEMLDSRKDGRLCEPVLLESFVPTSPNTNPRIAEPKTVHNLAKVLLENSWSLFSGRLSLFSGRWSLFFGMNSGTFC